MNEMLVEIQVNIMSVSQWHTHGCQKQKNSQQHSLWKKT